MKRTFADTLLEEAKKNKDIYLLTGDLGFKMFDTFKEELPDQYINCGAAEHTMMDMAIGLAYAGKIPFVYSITPFLLYRPFEALRTYVSYESLNIKLIGGGRNHDYDHDGISHWADDAGLVLQALPNITQYWPHEKQEIPVIVREMLTSTNPCFLSLKR